MTQTARRASRWGAEAPASEHEARDRILEAAERCYLRFGVERTTVEDIARDAQIHRTTVYSYFPNRDDILTGVLLRDIRRIEVSSKRVLDGPGSFAERMVRSFSEAYQAIKGSRFLSLLFDAENATFIVRAAAASEVLRERTRRGLVHYISDAMATGELRDDLTPEAMARWLMRVHVMLLTDPPEASEGGPERVLERFVVPSLVAGSSTAP